MKILAVLLIGWCIVKVVLSAYLHNIDAAFGWAMATIYSTLYFNKTTINIKF